MAMAKAEVIAIAVGICLLAFQVYIVHDNQLVYVNMSCVLCTIMCHAPSLCVVMSPSPL